MPKIQSRVGKINKRKMKKINFLFVCTFVHCCIYAQRVDYSVVSVPEESGVEFTRVTTDHDCVCMPKIKRTSKSLTWWSNNVIDITQDGKSIAYLSYRNNATNIFIRDLDKQGSSIQRTNRQEVVDFSFSPDGNYLCFSENRNGENQIFQTDAKNGYVCRQITSGAQDFSPMYRRDMSCILFARQEKVGVSIWSYNVKNNYVASYSTGANPYPLSGTSAYLCTRLSPEGKGEIWKVDYDTNIEECILSHNTTGYSSPRISPDGKWILCVGESVIQNNKKVYRNTDIFVCRIDGTQLTQLTFHAADDISPIWSKDGKYIYFVSQRGSETGTANIWKMNFNVL